MMKVMKQIGLIIDQIPLEFMVNKNEESQPLRDLVNDIHFLVGKLNLRYPDLDKIFRSFFKITNRIRILVFRNESGCISTNLRKIATTTICKDSVPLCEIPENFDRFIFSSWRSKVKTYNSFQEILNSQSQPICSICLNNCPADPSAIALQVCCNHLFCFDCLEEENSRHST